jgi:D-threo-aldose 1-dehydrogenase
LHRATVSVIPGGQGRTEMESNLRAAGARVPLALWQALAAEGLIPDRLVPVTGG